MPVCSTYGEEFLHAISQFNGLMTTVSSRITYLLMTRPLTLLVGRS